MEQQQKKMNLTQLTFIVAVNMMGSGIIMLPANMAQVGAISLLSWVVTTGGSMAIAWGLAQEGFLNARPGGMSAYAEDAYGKSGFFMVFFLYYFSLAVANVAIATSAVGYLAPFFPWLTSTPIATCIGTIALIWLTTVANLRGAKITGRFGEVTVWGVIIPVGLLSVIGWFWFSSSTFAAAWNPHGKSFFDGMGSAIPLTLWAFLGFESAAQNSIAVENPKRNVPLACIYGMLIAAVIYILGTTVIQGIVKNADLAKSTAPFGLVYTTMFNSTVGYIIMALAAMACIGSLLAWQFTCGQTGRTAADDGLAPAFFSKLNRFDTPVIGMTVLAVVQSVMALSAISPSLTAQFAAVVNLAVVTNVVPYILALSGMMVMMRVAKTSLAPYQRNAVVVLIGMLYSVYAIYACGPTAIVGGTVVMMFGFIIWAYLVPRFPEQSAAAEPAEKVA
jgi:putrescine:ornithine antiporter